jgi:hypothetical protein
MTQAGFAGEGVGTCGVQPCLYFSTQERMCFRCVGGMLSFFILIERSVISISHEVN